MGADAIRQLSLNIVHIMAMTRLDLNRADAVERKDDIQFWFDELGRLLEEELKSDKLNV